MTASPINRRCEEELKHLRNEFPILAIVGPRQSGKTTLAKKAFPGYTYVSLEDPDRREFARDDPRGFLGRYSQDVIIDEVQRVPPLMSYLQSHVDALGKMGSVVITGSHNFQLMERIGQSLAGRVGILTLLPLSWEEIGNPAMPLHEYIFTGGSSAVCWASETRMKSTLIISKGRCLKPWRLPKFSKSTSISAVLSTCITGGIITAEKSI